MTRDFQATAVPIDIVSALGLRVGMAYSGQVVTRDVVLHLREGTAAPAITDPGHVIVSREPFAIRPVTGQGIYLWTVRGGPADVVLTEST